MSSANTTWRTRAWRILRRDCIDEFSRSSRDGRGDRASVEANTRRLVSRTIAEAARSIPFYRDHWAGRGLLAAAERGDVALSDLPPLTKDQLRQGYELLQHPTFAPSQYVVRATGGSTGEPIRFAQTRKYIERATGRGLRSLTWGGWSLAARTAMVWGGPNELTMSSGIRGRLKAFVTNRRTYDAFRTGDAVYAGWLDEWDHWRPEFVIGYASALDGLASHLLTRGRPVRGISAVFSTAEKLYPEQRARIERAFAAPVRDQYGSREVLSVAAQCTHGAMHAYLDSAYLELVPTAHGNAVALTQLDNEVMPLIRYLNDDLARWLDGSPSCPCGLHYPVLAEITGRTSDLFSLPGGKVVHGEFFTHVMYDVQGVAAFQFHQAGDGRITLYVVPTSGSRAADVEATLRPVLSKLPAQLDASFPIEVRIVNEIPRKGQGKHRFTISEYRPNG